MDIPESIVRVPVVGSLLRVVLDSKDVGSVPDARELPNLRAVVEATVPYLEVGEHDLYIMDRFVFHTNQAGEIINPASPDDAPEVPATTGNGPEFLYQVQLLWDGQTEKQKNLFLWRATAAESLNLGRVINAPTPEDIPGWMQAMVEVADARQEISGWRDDVEQWRDEAQTFRDQAAAVASGDVIDDDLVAADTTYSSAYIEDLVGGRAPSAHTHTWPSITGKPTVFPPSPHSHPVNDLTGVLGESQLPARARVAVDEPWAWAAGTEAVLSVPTHEGSGETTHPSVLYFESGWNGYKYWMAHTPYPNGNEAHEDPNIVVSNDGVTWTVPSGLTNPLDDQAGNPNPHNSDVNLVMRGNTMHLVWRMVDRPNGNATRIFWRTSTNGTTWTAKREIFAPSHGFVSPSLAWTGSRWEMWGFDGSTLARFHTTTSLPGTSTTWTRTNCSIPSVKGIRRWWHAEVKRLTDGTYIAAVIGYDGLGAARGGDLYMASSADGVTWKISDVPLLGAAPAGQSRYAGSLVPIGGTGTDLLFELYASRISWSGSTSDWRLTRSLVSVPATLGGIAVRARQRPTVREWTPLNVDASLDISGLKCTLEDRTVKIKGRITRSAGAVTASNMKAFSLPSDGLKPPQELRLPVGYGASVGKVRVAPSNDPLWVKLFAHDDGNIAASATFYVDLEWDV